MVSNALAVCHKTSQPPGIIRHTVWLKQVLRIWHSPDHNPNQSTPLDRVGRMSPDWSCRSPRQTLEEEGLEDACS